MFSAAVRERVSPSAGKKKKRKKERKKEGDEDGQPGRKRKKKEGERERESEKSDGERKGTARSSRNNLVPTRATRYYVKKSLFRSSVRDEPPTLSSSSLLLLLLLLLCTRSVVIRASYSRPRCETNSSFSAPFSWLRRTATNKGTPFHERNHDRHKWEQSTGTIGKKKKDEAGRDRPRTREGERERDNSRVNKRRRTLAGV